eukprot:TRINITY_DN11413_c0_g2_i1.p1 TRINITY_DN11413_c0_g2~~TRINITY_DN11413_c0_g2_i1.p1  ORF type:complete len:180 (+),score=95.21 TRINITY_DN11413_c0_g2_i1:94-633(+)
MAEAQNKAEIGEGRAGMFNCSGPCGRKRLVAAEFSAKMVQRWQQNMDAGIMCKTCTLKQQEEKAKCPAAAEGEESLTCSVCEKVVPKSGYSNSQLKRLVVQHNKQRCKQCTLEAEKAERDGSAAKKEANLVELRKKAEEAEKSGNKALALKCLSEAAAAEAAIHSGVKVQKPKPKFRRR